MRRRTKIEQLDKEGNVIKVYPSVAAAAEEHNVSTGAIYQCFSNPKRKSAGFKWRRAEKEVIEEPVEPPARRTGKGPAFYCQGCGEHTGPSHKFLICETCSKRLVKRKTDGKFDEVVHIPIKKSVLAEVVDRALDLLLKREEKKA